MQIFIVRKNRTGALSRIWFFFENDKGIVNIYFF